MLSQHPNSDTDPKLVELGTKGSEIIPQSTNIDLTSDHVTEDSQARTFFRFMSMKTLQSMSVRNLMVGNKVFRKRACTIVANVVARIFTLGMNIVLLMLSVAYCIARLSSARLKVVRECVPMDAQDIYQHSYLSGLNENGSVSINEESQWGWTNDPCITTKTYQDNVDHIWYSNVYVHEWSDRVDYAAVLFGLLGLYSFGILVYNLVSISTDIHHLRHNTLHTLSKRRRDSLDKKAGSEQRGPVLELPTGIGNIWWLRAQKLISDLLETDTTRWVAHCVGVEFVEFAVAINQMLLYNGYYWNAKSIGKLLLCSYR